MRAEPHFKGLPDHLRYEPYVSLGGFYPEDKGFLGPTTMFNLEDLDYTLLCLNMLGGQKQLETGNPSSNWMLCHEGQYK